MLPTKEIYSTYPSIFPADKTSCVTIAPLERAFCFVEDAEYTVSIVSVNSDDVSNYYTAVRPTFTVVAHGGVLKFDYCFGGEQEHMIVVEREENALCRLFVYSLYEDLYSTIPLKGDFHSHSYRSDGQRDPAALAGFYREQGYDCFALTDHNRFYPGGEIDEVYEGVNTGFLRVSGEEVHAPSSPVHIVRIGGDVSVCEQYHKNPEKYDAEVAEYEKRVPESVPEKYVYRYARAMWATDKIHEAGGLAIFPHPYWRPKALVYNVCDEFTEILLKSGMFDAYELVGGMGQIGINRSINLWSELRAEGLEISVVGSSDVHKIENSIYFPFCFTLVFANEQTEKSVLEAIKTGRSVAVEANGTDEYARQFRAYGKFRYASYAQFLLAHYFPKYERYCESVGISMRAYAMGDAPKELVELNEALAERFRMRYFGRMDALCPSDEMLAFENKWRAVQLQGPLNKGSNIYGAHNMQI
jgi:hypothetical protein